MNASDPRAEPPELWGGFECTVVRIGDRFRDQMALTCHHRRPEDLDAVAELGIRTLRYPVVWETISPEGPDEEDWSLHDARLGRLRDLGIRVIAGLVHHGSGPRRTNLLDPAFPQLLARHAERVARRYPWIEDFTPINEPLTTARFSALYGHWHPHARDERSFAHALVHQCLAVVESMRAIRRITPQARLVQTEDLGKTFARRPLAHQAEYENLRRWLSLDLLTGRVDRAHPWHEILRRHGVSEAALATFAAGEAVPDIVGINHYLTSERYLDDRLALYPEHLHGGNGRQAYADAEAVRVRLAPAALGPEARLREAWERYRLPVAVTEAHHGCTREEQLRWLAEVRNAACALRREGADIRAVTVWALLGAVDWNSLLTRDAGVYEPGVFDVRGGTPRPTALAAAAKSYAAGRDFDHPVLDLPGWWRRPGRHYRPQRGLPKLRGGARTILITGAGRLARAFARICDHRGLAHVMLPPHRLDLTDPLRVREALDGAGVWAVIHCAGFSGIRRAEAERERRFRTEVLAAATLAEVCAARGLPLIAPSTDHVFDGVLGRPYVEHDPVCPADAFGEMKAEAERRIVAAGGRSLVVRTGPVFSAWSERDPFTRALLRLARGARVAASDAGLVSPGYAPDLAHAALDLMIDGETGLRHLSNPGAETPYALLARSAKAFGFEPRGLRPIEEETPRGRALVSLHGEILPPLDSAFGRYHQEARGLVQKFASLSDGSRSGRSDPEAFQMRSF